MVDVSQIIQSTAERVDTFFSGRASDPFTVTFGKGLYTQTGNDLKPNDQTDFLFLWMMSPYDIDRRDPEFDYYTGDIIIGMNTSPEYTMDERNTNSFTPRLIPVYEKFMEELDNALGIEHRYYPHVYRPAPFWGLGEPNGATVNNLWSINADCLIIKDLKLKLYKEQNSCAKTI